MFLAATLDRGGSYWWRPRGMSMVPVIRDGERVLIGPARASALRIGDVVKFWLEGEFRLHRLVRRGGRGPDWFEFQGDTLRERDARVGPEAIIGVAVAVEREGQVRRLDSRGARLRGLGKVVLMRLRSDGARSRPGA